MKKETDSTPISIRIKNTTLSCLKEIAREKAFKEKRDISYVDLIRMAIDKTYFGKE